MDMRPRPQAPQPVAQPRPQVRRPEPVRPPQPQPRPVAPARPAPVQAQRPAAAPMPAQAPAPAKSSRGLWWVILQFVIGLLVVVGVAAAIIMLYIKYYQ